MLPWCLAAALLVLVAAPLAGQQGSVGGVVLGAETGQPLVGAQVSIEGTNRGTVTNQQGRFLLPGVSDAVTLRVTMIGYRSATLAARPGQLDLRVELAETAVELDQIVVTGTAGGQRKRALGNVVSTIDASEIVDKAPVATVSEILNGRTPGVAIINSTGMLGSGTRVRIRGANSFSLSNEPLVYVDGVRVNNDQSTGPTNQAFGSSSISRWNDINPDDIESIEVIKGPAAATLYGTEAANGVIQIITKRGRTGETRFGFSTKQGALWFANPEERLWVNYFDVGRDGTVESIDMVELEQSRGREIWQTGHTQEYDLNVSGGSDNFRYYVAGNLENSTGVEPDNRVDRFGGRANFSATPSEKWDLNTSVAYTTGRIDVPFEAGGGGLTWSTYFARPDRLVAPHEHRRGFWSGTPESYIEGFDSWQDLDRMTGSINVAYRPTEWLTNRLVVGHDQTREQDNEIQYHDTRWVQFFSFADRGYKFTRERNITVNTIDYAGTVSLPIGAALQSSTSFGGQFYRNYIESVFAYGEVFPVPGLTSINATTQGHSTGESSVENVTVGVYGQQQFAWNDRVFVTAALRADDNSAFGEEFDLVYYPKVSGAWVISEEGFWDFDWLNTLRLRAAYGESGQQPTAFAAIRTFAPVTGPSDVGTVTPSNLGNPALGPERGKEIEAGFDAGFLNDRVGVEFTYYNQRTTDAILLREIAPSTGFSGSQFVNAGEVRNSGIELLLRGEPWRTDRHGLEMVFNISTNENEVVSLGDVTEEEFIGVGGYVQHRIGYPIGSWFSKRVVSAELNAQGRATNLMCDDGQGGATSCATAPEVFLGRTVPDVEGGFNSTLTLFGNVRLFGQLDFKRGFHKLDGNYRVRCIFFAECRENWFPEEFDAAHIAEVQAGGTYGGVMIDDASFLKLRELSASYTLPTEWAGRFGARGASINLAGRNLYTWTDYMGLEPESTFHSGSRGGNFHLWEQNVLPQLAQFVATLNVNF